MINKEIAKEAAELVIKQLQSVDAKTETSPSGLIVTINADLEVQISNLTDYGGDFICTGKLTGMQETGLRGIARRLGYEFTHLKK